MQLCRYSDAQLRLVAVSTILRLTTNTPLRLEFFLYGSMAASVSKREQGDAGNNG